MYFTIEKFGFHLNNELILETTSTVVPATEIVFLQNATYVVGSLDSFYRI